MNNMIYVNLTDYNNNTIIDRVGYEFLVRDSNARIVRTMTLEDIMGLVDSSSMRCTFYLYALHDDETVKEDLSPYILSGGSLSIDYKIGVRRNLSINIFNAKNWVAHPFKGFLWKGSKFKLEVSIKTTLVEYVCSAGVFILKDFEVPHKYIQNEIKLEMVDKFGGLDGTVGGKIVDDIYIPRGSNIVQAVKGLLLLEKAQGVPFDTKTPMFPPWAYRATTPYSITESSDSTFGSLIIKLLSIINLDVFYDEHGRLCTEEMRENILVDSLPSLWTFENKNRFYASHNLKTDFQAVENVVVVEGANINGDIVSVRVENNNPKSPTNVTIFEPTICKVIDENIANVGSALARAKYELFKRSLLPMSETFSTVLIPALNVNNAVTINDECCGLVNSKFLINSISIPIMETTKMNLTVNNLEEVALNG